MIPAETIQKNWEIFIGNIQKHITGERKQQLLDFYNFLEDQIILAPASSREAYHNAFPGGYVDHVNRVVDYALKFHEVWVFESNNMDYTKEELVFAALHHDLGKVGLKDAPQYIPNPSEWHVKNLGQIYKNNPDLDFMTVPDRALFMLQDYGIKVSLNETLGIKLTDGMYDEANKPYLMGYDADQRIKCNIPLILHQADMMASRVEWENHYYLPKKNGERKPVEKKKVLNTPQAKQEVMNRVASANPGFLAALKNL